MRVTNNLDNKRNQTFCASSLPLNEKKFINAFGSYSGKKAIEAIKEFIPRLSNEEKFGDNSFLYSFLPGSTGAGIDTELTIDITCKKIIIPSLTQAKTKTGQIINQIMTKLKTKKIKSTLGTKTFKSDSIEYWAKSAYKYTLDDFN